MKKGWIAAGAGAALLAGGFGLYRWTYRMPLREYTSHALYMAVLNDEICRRELGDLVDIPSWRESLQDKYHLFLQLNRRKSRKALREETMKLEYRLRGLQKREEQGDA